MAPVISSSTFSDDLSTRGRPTLDFRAQIEKGVCCIANRCRVDNRPPKKTLLSVISPSLIIPIPHQQKASRTIGSNRTKKKTRWSSLAQITRPRLVFWTLFNRSHPLANHPINPWTIIQHMQLQTQKSERWDLLLRSLSREESETVGKWRQGALIISLIFLTYSPPAS